MFRFIKKFNVIGPYASALNKYLIESNCEPTLVFYTFPMTLIIGRSQPIDTVDMKMLKETDSLICRRESYGNAVLVSNKQICYAVIVGRNYYDYNKLVLFDKIQNKFFKILSELGIEGKLAPEQVREEFQNLNCMAGIGKNEILNKKGMKLISGSCTEFDTGYLQEGVIIIEKSIRNVVKYIKEDQWTAQRRQAMLPPSSLEEELKTEITPEDITKIMYNVMELKDYTLNDKEINKIEELQTKFDSKDWVWLAQ